MKQKLEKFVVRMPKELRERLKEAAQTYRRSQNSEFVARLEYSLYGMPDRIEEDAIAPDMFATIERVVRGDVTDEEAELVRCFRRMSGKQRKALLDLIT